MMKRALARFGLVAVLLVSVGILQSPAQDLQEAFESSVTEFTLDNGLQFVVVERSEAPVVTFYTYADVGAVDEVKGITGMAHMFEHMAFKGTRDIGSKDLEAELAAMAEVDALHAELKAARQALDPDPERISELEEAFAAAQERARDLNEPGEFEEIIERNGGTGLNASTNWDRTDYFYSLPANKLELWFSLESDRFLNPVLREFYTERDVIAEERRMRTDSNPIGRLLEEFFALAYKAHPYGEPIIGHMSDIQTYSREEAIDFFETYYNAANLTIAIVGAVDPQEVRTLAETYFSRLPAGTKPGRVETAEPEQLGERRMVIREQSQPAVVMGWKKGSVNHPDDPVFEIIADVLSAGRTSLLYTNLVETGQALQVEALNSFPGLNKYPNMFLALAIPNRNVEVTDVEQNVYDVLETIKEEGISEDALARAKTRARANLVRGLQSRTGVAQSMAYYEVVTGDWRNLFSRLEALEAVTNEDVMRVAQETFTQSNRTVAMIQTQEQGTADAAAPAATEDASGR